METMEKIMNPFFLKQHANPAQAFSFLQVGQIIRELRASDY
jgi:hypothetical protein